MLVAGPRIRFCQVLLLFSLSSAALLISPQTVVIIILFFFIIKTFIHNPLSIYFIYYQILSKKQKHINIVIYINKYVNNIILQINPYHLPVLLLSSCLLYISLSFLSLLSFHTPGKVFFIPAFLVKIKILNL